MDATSGKYRILEQWSRRRWLLFFIAAVTINASVFTVLQLCFPTGALHQYLTDLFGKYSNMFTMSGSLALVLCFAGIHFRSAVVNRLSMSAFSLFVIHVNPYMTLRFSEFLSGILDRCPHCRVRVMIAVIVTFYIFWAIIDQLRIWLWQALTTRHRQK